MCPLLTLGGCRGGDKMQDSRAKVFSASVCVWQQITLVKVKEKLLLFYLFT